MSRPAPKPRTLAGAREALALLMATLKRTEDAPMPANTSPQPLRTPPAPRAKTRAKTRAQIAAEARARVEARRAAEEDALYRRAWPEG